MKVYFTGSIYFKNQCGQNFEKIVSSLVEENIEVQSDHILNISMNDIEATTYQGSVDYYKRVKKWISEADVVVAEISFPSTINVGHEVTLALEMAKPVLAFYKKGSESIFLNGIEDENFNYIEYSDSDLEKVVKNSIEYVKKRQLKRFNLMLEPNLISYLNKKSKEISIPKSQIIRNLISKMMEKDNL